MAPNSRRRNALIALFLLLILAVLLLLLTRCPRSVPPRGEGTPAMTSSASTPEAQPAGPAPVDEPEETLTSATLSVPERVAAGTAFTVGWTGPDNPGDFVTIVERAAPGEASASYRETREGTPTELTAPIEPGSYEVRYVTGRTRTVLGRAPIEVEPVAAALDAAAEVVLGASFPVEWAGPNNTGDYVTIVPKGATDEQYGSYADTAKGSPLTLTAPTVIGEAELRYVSGQGRTVLARRPIRVIGAEVVLDAPAEAIAGTTIDVAWTGPNNAGDYLTVVPAGTPDGQYANYTNTSSGSPLKLLTPIMAGDAELRYMTGQGHHVLARRPLRIVAAEVTLSGPAECPPGAAVDVRWTGPNNPGDYITIVPREAPDGQYADYRNTSEGSPLTVRAPPKPGDAEIRYMTGQGDKVLARVVIKVVP